MSDDIAIRVRELGKKYVIGGAQVQYHTPRDAIVNSLKAPFVCGEIIWHKMISVFFREVDIHV